MNNSINLPGLDLTLDGVVNYWSKRIPESDSVIIESRDDSTRITWRELESGIARCAAYILENAPNSKAIGIGCQDSIECHIAIMACLRAGKIVTLIDESWGDELIRDILNYADVKLFFSSRGLNGKNIESRELPKHSEYCDYAGVVTSLACPTDIAFYAFTSGTTSTAKCVPIPHYNIRYAYKSCIEQRFNVFPMKFACLFKLTGIGIYGINYLLSNEVGASTTKLKDHKFGIEREWVKIVNGDFDFVYLVPPLIRLINVSKHSSNVTKSNRICLTASAPISEKEMVLFESKNPFRLYNCYGLTELTFAVFFGCRNEGDLPSSSIGLPKHIDVKTVPLNGMDEELYIKGKMLVSYYLNNDQDSKETFQEGWLRTGDLCRKDDKGRYYIVGRMKDVVMRGGFSIHLSELDNYFKKYDGIVDACSFRGREIATGDELCIMIQSCEFEEEKFRDWVLINFGKYRVPDKIFITSCELPRNGSGKVSKQIIRKMYVDSILG